MKLKYLTILLILATLAMGILLVDSTVVSYADNTLLGGRLEVIFPSLIYNNTPKSLEFKLDGVKVDPTDILYTLVDCFDEEAVYSSNLPPVDAGEYLVSFTLDVDGMPYQDDISMVVERAAPAYILINNPDNSFIYGSFVKFEGVVVGLGGFSQNVSFNYTFEEDQPSVGNYTAIAVFEGSRNFLPSQLPHAFSITPKPINVIIAEESNFRYSGLNITKGFSYDFDEYPLSDGYVYLRYNDELYAKNVGEYTVTAHSSSQNYVVDVVVQTPSQEFKLIIEKTKLIITAKDISVLEGEDIHYSFTYSGFVGNENDNYLQQMPIVEGNYKTVGIHEITPSGAVSNNYFFEYVAGKLTINATRLEGAYENNRVFIDGQFKPQTIMVFDSPLKDGITYEAIYLAVKNTGKIFSKSDMDYIFELKFAEGGMLYGTTFKGSITSVKLSPFYRYRVAVVDSQNNYYNADYVYKNGTITFTSHVTGYVIIHKEPLMTYFVFAGVGILILIIVLYKLGSHISYKKLKKQKTNTTYKKG